ncbi:MAG: GTPase ObgE [Candidatus Paceibacterota bacterium]|jgi:GTP-binding protein
MLIDDVTIKVKAGNGGDGAVAFNKNMMELGPTGARGGNGGSIYGIGVSELDALRQFRYIKEIVAKDGQAGRGQFIDGGASEDIFLKLPVGTIIHNLDNRTDYEIINVGEKVLIAKGGIGGRGNFHFRSSTNTSPKEFEEGKTGQTFAIRLELKLIADIGLVGLPNAGKSSLINEITNAKSKVANYPFTTLEPHLGVFEDLIIADIPGIIEGASQNKGLGIKFLRHIERTKIIFHLISCENTKPIAAYREIRKELEKYNKIFKTKPEYVFLTKTDMVDKKVIDKLKKQFTKISPSILCLSIYDYDSFEKLKKLLYKLNAKKQKGQI